MSALAVVPDVEPTLDDLAEEINAAHGHATTYAAKALEHAILAGRALLRARDMAPHGEWRPWLERNVDMSYSLVLLYMRCAMAGEEALALAGVTSIKHAALYIRDHRIRLQVSLEQAAEIRRLAADGVRNVDIAERVGVGLSTVSRYRTDSELGHREKPHPAAALKARWTPHRIPIDDDMIERTAEWLVKRFADAGYCATVSDQVRADAVELLGTALRRGA